MGLFGALRGLSAAAKIVRAIQIAGTTVKIYRQVKKTTATIRYIRKHTKRATSSGSSHAERQDSRDKMSRLQRSMASEYIRRYATQSR